MHGGVFSCWARSRPNQNNVSMAGVLYTPINHRPTAIRGPGLKTATTPMPHRPVDWCPYPARARTRTISRSRPSWRRWARESPGAFCFKSLSPTAHPGGYWRVPGRCYFSEAAYKFYSIEAHGGLPVNHVNIRFGSLLVIPRKDGGAVPS